MTHSAKNTVSSKNYNLRPFIIVPLLDLINQRTNLFKLTHFLESYCIYIVYQKFIFSFPFRLTVSKTKMSRRSLAKGKDGWDKSLDNNIIRDKNNNNFCIIKDLFLYVFTVYFINL